MNELPLPGLRATEPIGFLAATGLLRICTARGAFGRVKLGWTEDATWSGVLFTEKKCDQDKLIGEWLGHMRGRSEVPAFSARPDRIGGAGVTNEPTVEAWDDIKVPLDHYRDRLDAVRATASQGHRESADFLTSLGSELISVSAKDAVKPSALHMTSGNQAFLEAVRDLAKSLDPDEPAHRKASCSPDEAFREAVFGQRPEGLPGWRAADEFSSMGYDPSREAVYALVATAPTSVGPRSTRAAVWLAVEALPLFPALPVGRRLWTRGFDKRATAFRWAVWDGSVGLDGLRTLLGHQDVSRPTPVAGRLRRLGIRAAMESQRVTIGQGYGQFRPAVRVGEISG